MSTDVKDLVECLRARAFRWATKDFDGSEARLAKDAADCIDRMTRERDALKVENDRLRIMVERAADIFRNCSVEDGICCCGDDMKRHSYPMECGHSPTDHGGYIADQWVKDYSDMHTTKGGEV